MPYIAIGTGEVYHEVSGAGEPLVLLHGGFCSIEVMRALGDTLSAHFEVHAVERAGHGRTADRPGPYSYATMADDTIAYLDTVGVQAAHVVGFSDGAIAGILLARDHGDRVRSLVAISGNLSTDAYVPDDYPYVVLTAEALEEVRREYDALSPDGPGHWDVVDEKLMALWTVEPAIPPASLDAITAPTLVMGGEHDAIRHDHLELVAASIPGAVGVTVVPGTTHMLIRERPDAVAQAILDFLGTRAPA